MTAEWLNFMEAAHSSEGLVKVVMCEKVHKYSRLCIWKRKNTQIYMPEFFIVFSHVQYMYMYVQRLVVNCCYNKE